MIGSFAYIAGCILLLAIALVMAFRSKRYAVAVAYLSLCAVALIAPPEVRMSPLLFWGVAMVIVLVIDRLLPSDISKSRMGLGYMAGGGLVGLMVGILVSAVVVGTFVGTLLGGIAYAKTPEGKALEFPSSKFLSYLCAKGFPAMITLCIIGIAIMWLIPDFYS